MRDRPQAAASDPGRRSRRLRRWPLAVALGVVLLLVANAHLVQVALESQPDCVPHLKEAGAGGGYRAARSAC